MKRNRWAALCQFEGCHECNVKAGSAVRFASSNVVPLRSCAEMDRWDEGPNGRWPHCRDSLGAMMPLRKCKHFLTGLRLWVMILEVLIESGSAE